MSEGEVTGSKAVVKSRRLTDRCESCGRFVGRYPVGFYCDTHCYQCVCTRCPGFRRPVGASHA